MQGIICDVGHTIITDSILNKILDELGKDASVKLYEEKQLVGKEQKAIDEWVRNVSRNKINSLRGLSLSKLSQYCQQASFTPGLKEFIDFTIKNNIPVLFIGAVPIVVTKFLLEAVGVNINQHKNIKIDGTTVLVVNDLLDKPIDICTPTEKFEAARSWMKTNSINTPDLIVVGDSIGDVLVMSLAERDNRIGIHVNSKTLSDLVGQEVDDFLVIVELVKEKLSNLAMI